MSKSNNNVVAMKETQVATQDTYKQEILATDILVPSIYLMQAQSKLVLAKKAQLGDMIRSTTGEKVGDENKGVNLIPLRYTTTWVEQEMTGISNGKKKFSYRKTVGRNAGNSRLPFTFFRDSAGKESDKPFMGANEWSRTQVINVYALLAEDVVAYNAEMQKAQESGEMPDMDKSLRPVCIAFRVSSYKAGQRVVDFYASYEDFKQSNPQLKSYGYSMPMTCKMVTGKDGNGAYYVYEMGSSKKIGDDLLKQAEIWYNRLCSSGVKVDESRLDEEGDSNPAAEQSQF